MTGGVVTGGWSFVIAAYALTAAVLLIYGVTLITRLREERQFILSKAKDLAPVTNNDAQPGPGASKEGRTVR